MESTKPEVTPTTVLDNRMKRVDILKKIDEIKFYRQNQELAIEQQKLNIQNIKNKEAGWNHPLSMLLEVARAWCIDNDQTVLGSEPAIRSLWSADELETIKSMILKKAMKL